MGETRAGKYGRNLALLVGFVIGGFDDKNYREKFISELKGYSFERRKKGEGRNSGCVYELDGLETVEINNPEQLARLVKEGIHLMYQKNTAQKVFNALVVGLERKI